MKRKGLLVICCLSFVISASALPTGFSQEQTSVESKSLPSDGQALPDAADRSQSKQLSGRLPRFFSTVVTPQQRLEIYEIQSNYRKKMLELQQQLDALKAAESKEIEQILSPIQLKQISEMRTEALSRASELRQQQPSVQVSEMEAETPSELPEAR